MDSKLNIPLHGASLHIVTQCRSALSDVLQSKFGCVVTIDGVEFEGDVSIAQKKRPEKRFAVVLHTGVQVSVCKDDLTNLDVDAVVNAANDRLQHIGGLALALSNAGGPKIQKESDHYINMHGPLHTGDAIISDAGSLPCKKIIHAVGPQLPYNPMMSDVSRAEVHLEKAIRNILDRVKENRLNTVAIPAISSGLFNYPLRECALTIVATVKRYYAKSSGHLPKEILLVNNDEPTVREMERACHQILAPYLPPTYSQAAAASKSRGDARTSTLTVEIGNVHLTLKKGRIEEQQTDVIVNTAYNRNLSSGQISKALLQKAGHGMQTEIDRASMTRSVIITKPYMLQCKQVYHTFCIEKGRDTAQQILYTSISDCLWLAFTNNHKSISFPAIGTGGLGFDKKDVAQIMSSAVVNFAQNVSLKIEVYFVIFPTDKDIFKAFEEQMRYLQQTASHPNFTLAREHRDDSHGSRAPTPQISLSSLSNEAIREAERWLQDLLFSSGSVVICNNFIQHFGEQEHLQLARLIEKGVSIEEFFVDGHASITLKGDSYEDVAVAGLQVEAMLCNIQREFVKEEERDMLLMASENVSFERKTVDSGPEYSEIVSAFKKERLRILKVDKVENPCLKYVFGLKQKQLCCSTPPRKMFQRIPVQFCEMVCQIGFHAEFAPPERPAYGEGIYFAGTVKKATAVWEVPNEEYLYFVEAEVLTGKSTPGKPGLILPPAVGTDPQSLYDSVSGGADISVIFSGYQALPKYIITCKKV
ncbi:protein mono-ADP-ribosyltransferase PARP9 [Siniperca chuatsi]|uniref:protein mono-ADP-ribosyltransferase PARP9 n=1 Tax=Siniperca chuatsi TaxID=119488 RepID=UPI001CE12DC3|nr:protein mono-ADP-ribosyltransferase PARP9 [Siniperca chuatsi]